MRCRVFFLVFSLFFPYVLLQIQTRALSLFLLSEELLIRNLGHDVLGHLAGLGHQRRGVVPDLVHEAGLLDRRNGLSPATDGRGAEPTGL